MLNKHGDELCQWFWYNKANRAKIRKAMKLTEALQVEHGYSICRDPVTNLFEVSGITSGTDTGVVTHDCSLVGKIHIGGFHTHVSTTSNKYEVIKVRESSDTVHLSPGDWRNLILTLHLNKAKASISCLGSKGEVKGVIGYSEAVDEAVLFRIFQMLGLTELKEGLLAADQGVGILRAMGRDPGILTQKTEDGLVETIKFMEKNKIIEYCFAPDDFKL